MDTPTILVTGATDGIGRETASELCRLGARVLVHGRDRDKAMRVTDALRVLATQPHDGETKRAMPLEPTVADFASLLSVREMAAELGRRQVKLDVLVNNAGIFATKRLQSTDGYELTFAVNHLAPFALSHALLASPVGASLQRIVNVSSMAHSRGKLTLADLCFERRDYDGHAAYADSKLANVLFTVELAKLLRGRNVDVNALHPGVVTTKLLTAGFGMSGPDSLAAGAKTSVLLAMGSELRGKTGSYYAAGVSRPMNPQATDAAFCHAFYLRSAELAGVAPLV
jgi:retinol dehydrogenase 14